MKWWLHGLEATELVSGGQILDVKSVGFLME